MFWEEEYLKKKPMFFVFLKNLHLAPIFKIFYFCLAGGEDAHEDKLKHLTVEFKVLLSRVKDFIGGS